VTKPAFDRPGDARPIKSRFYTQFPILSHVIYSSPVWTLDSHFLSLTSVRLMTELSELSAHVAEIVPFNSTAKIAPRMHIKIRLFELKNRKIFSGGHTAPFPDPSTVGRVTPLPTSYTLGAFGASTLAPSACPHPRPTAPRPHLHSPVATPSGPYPTVYVPYTWPCTGRVPCTRPSTRPSLRPVCTAVYVPCTRPCMVRP